LIKFEGHQTFDQKLKIFPLVLVVDGRCFGRLDSRLSNMFDAGMRTTLVSGLCTYQLFDLCLIKQVLTV